MGKEVLQPSAILVEMRYRIASHQHAVIIWLLQVRRQSAPGFPERGWATRTKPVSVRVLAISDGQLRKEGRHAKHFADATRHDASSSILVEVDLSIMP